MISAVIEDGYLPGVWKLRVWDGDRLIDEMSWSDDSPATLQRMGASVDGRMRLWFSCNGCNRTLIVDEVSDRRAA